VNLKSFSIKVLLNPVSIQRDVFWNTLIFAHKRVILLASSPILLAIDAKNSSVSRHKEHNNETSARGTERNGMS